MTSKGTQRINAPPHLNKDDVANRFKDLKEIITQNSNIPFKDAIFKIAKINAGIFYNYIYPGKQKGQVSLYTLENLSNYFNLPKEIFTSESPLDQNVKNQIIYKLNEKLNAESVSQKINSFSLQPIIKDLITINADN